MLSDYILYLYIFFNYFLKVLVDFFFKKEIFKKKKEIFKKKMKWKIGNW